MLLIVTTTLEIENNLMQIHKQHNKCTVKLYAHTVTATHWKKKKLKKLGTFLGQ